MCGVGNAGWVGGGIDWILNIVYWLLIIENYEFSVNYLV